MSSKNSLKKVENLDDDTVIICLDEAHFTIDADRRKCWARKGTKPIVYKNGSKKAINVGGALTWIGKFHYQEMERQNKEEVLKFIKRLHKRYKKVLFILDKATWHKNNLVMEYFNDNKETTDYMFFPTGAADVDPVEECWRQTREEKTANTSHDTVEALRISLKSFWNGQPFNLNLSNYLCP